MTNFTEPKQQNRPDYLPGHPQVFYPHWGNDRKTLLCAIIRTGPDDVTMMRTEDQKSQFWQDVFTLFDREEVDRNTEIEINRINQIRETEKAEQHAAAKKQKQEELFQAKVQMFDIPEVDACTDASIKNNIRRAKTHNEVIMWASVAAMQAKQVKDESGQSE